MKCHLVASSVCYHYLHRMSINLPTVHFAINLKYTLDVL